MFGSPGRGPDGVKDALNGGADTDVAVASSSDKDLVTNSETMIDIK